MYLKGHSDEEIIKLYKEGHEEAFKELVDRYTSPLYGFTLRFTDPKHAPDILQDIFIKVWKNLSKWNEDKASFKTWIFTITRNTVTDFLRKKKSFLFSQMNKNGEDEGSSFEENIPDEQLLPDEAMQKLQEVDVLNSALDKLPSTYKEVLILHYQEEMTFGEIGKVLNKSLNTVKSQHRRAVLELRKHIQ